MAATEADGTIWVFGGVGEGNRISGRHEGYDPAIDSWKGGEDLPVPVQHAMAVTWQGTPVVLGGWRTEGARTNVATDRVWRVVNSRWAELPPLLQPRAAASAAVVGDRIIVTGGVDASGTLLDTTEIFDGTRWTLGAAIPTLRQMPAAASDGRLVYVVGGANGSTDLATVEAYDPAADSWTALPPLPQPRSDVGATSADGRLVVVGGRSSGQVLRSVAAFDVVTRTWTALPTWPQRAAAWRWPAWAGRSTRSAGRRVPATTRSPHRRNRCDSARADRNPQDSGGRCRMPRPRG